MTPQRGLGQSLVVEVGNCYHSTAGLALKPSTPQKAVTHAFTRFNSHHCDAAISPRLGDVANTFGQPRIVVFCAGPSLERARPLLEGLSAASLRVEVQTDGEFSCSAIQALQLSQCDAVLVLWSPFFVPLRSKLLEMAEVFSKSSPVLLNDVPNLVDMQDRVWLLKKLKEHGIPSPGFVECVRGTDHEPVLEEHDDYIVVAGSRINKPFVEKPVDRRDREIYVYFPKSAGGGRALLSTRESGDVEYCCRFDPVGRVRRQGSFVYQEFFQSEGFMVQVVCVGGLAYGNAVLSGIVSQASSIEKFNSEPKSSQPCAVWLRQEEKLIASKLNVVFQQTLFGITFVRSQTANGPATSYVIDVWPGIPRSGVGAHRDDVVRALIGAMNRRLPANGTVRRSKSMPRVSFPNDDDFPYQEAVDESPSCSTSCACSVDVGDQQSYGVPRTLSRGPWDESDSDRLCVLVVARHGERTPKQKVKAKVALESEFAAGWLSGWLAGASVEAATAVAPPAMVELRSPDQLTRLGAAAKKLLAEGHKVGTLVDALTCVGGEGQACHSKITFDKAKLTVALKWGGELTPAGMDESEAFGRSFRHEAFPNEDIDELHATLRHDIKIYASREARCQQTAAAFCKGFLRLVAPLPPIIAAMVRTDEFGRLEPGTGYTSSDKAPAEPPQEAKWDASFSASTWDELEAVAGGPVVAPILREFAALGDVLQIVWERMERVRVELEGDMLATLYLGETAALLRERYRDAVGDFGPKESLSFAKVPHLLDHLEYDRTHNTTALPTAALAALDAALPLCEALCDLLVPLEVAVERRAMAATTNGASAASVSDQAGPLLNKLRWDLRVASGANLGQESEHLKKHEALYSAAAAATATSSRPCVRTRLYFTHNSHLQGLVTAMLDGAKGDSSQTTVPRLGFLSHIIVQLWRRRSDGGLSVSCHYAQRGGEVRHRLFQMPLESVDAWWSGILDARVGGQKDEDKGSCQKD